MLVADILRKNQEDEKQRAKATMRERAQEVSWSQTVLLQLRIFSLSLKAMEEPLTFFLTLHRDGFVR